MGRICRIATAVFGLAYVLALVILVIGTFGLFGQHRDPLSGVYLLPLALPWIYLVDLAPEPAWPWLTALAPAGNLVILGALCRYLGRREKA